MKENTKTSKSITNKAFMAALAFFALACVAPAQTFTWLPTEASTKDSPYLWTDSANWAEFKDAGTGYPQGADVTVEMVGDFFSGTADQYVKIPDEGLTLGGLKFAASKASMHFIGGKLTFSKTSGSSSLIGSWNTGVYPYFHCDVEAVGDLTQSQMYRSKISGGFSVAGMICQDYCAEIRACDRADLVADNTYRDLYPRRWTMQGLNVTIEIFGGNYQLYQTFDVITNKTYGTCGFQPMLTVDNTTLEGLTGAMVWFDIKKLVGSSNVRQAMDGQSEHKMGTVRLYDLSEFTGGVDVMGSGRIWLCRTETGADPVLNAMTQQQVSGSSHTLRLCVPETSEIATIKKFVGCDHASVTKNSVITKWGPGALRICDYQPNCERGRVDVRDGTLSVSNATGVIDQPFLEMQDGTVLEVEAGVTLNVGVAAFYGTVTVKGPGKLNVVRYETVPEKIILLDGAEVPLRSTADDEINAQVVPEVRGDPAFWLDASDLSRGVENVRGKVDGNGHVYRWNDTRTATGDEGYMFATNFNPASEMTPFLELEVTQNGGARVAMPRNYSATSYANARALCWDRPLTNITSVFMIHDPEMGGGQFLGTTPRLVRMGAITGGGDSSPWYRGHWDPNDRPNILNGRVADWAHIYDAEWRLNGALVEDVSKEGFDFTGGPQLLEFHPDSGVIPADAFSCDATTAGNGQSRYFEIIIYTNKVSELDRRCVAAYLTKKWLEKPYVRPDDERGFPSMIAGSGSIEIAAGDSVTLSRTDVGSELVLAGAGDLTISLLEASSFTVRNGSLTILNDVITDESQLPEGLAYHMDATRAATSFDVYKTTNGTNFYGRIRDVREDAPFEVRARSSSLVNLPYLRENALNGLPVLDFGPLGPAQYDASTRMLMQTMKAPTSTYKDDKGQQAIPNVTATYQIFGSEYGGNTIFDGPTIAGSDTPNAIAARDITDPTGYVASKSSRMGLNGRFSLNGKEYLSSESAHLSGLFDLIAWQQNGVAASIVDIAAFAFKNHRAYQTGGQLLGEVLIYTNILSKADHRRIQSYLNNKWFGSYLEDCKPATLSALRVEKDAMAKVDGAMLALNEVGGGGALTDGDFTLMNGGVIELQVLADGSVAPLAVVSGATLTVLGGGSIRLVGEVSKIGAVESELVTGNVIFADPEAMWTVETEEVHRRTFGVKKIDGRPYFFSRKPGMLVFFR